ncbi:hypothetical protein ACFPVV_09610 [Macrococcoides bohemicum]|uniref:Uncharacterized protein n=1 Tax=Macrococcoides bohemicum TaxID=1903056 RepID=A0A328A1P4_9STAP|nr:hypothetical protein [Macrococcus bohemicus]RAK48450.1 hypothetical protein BHX94_11285 [Macrococcus bohemicus]
MLNKHLQTHIDTCYVCFLPSQISQLRPLLENHKAIIEAQYPLRDKTLPYFISSENTLFLFIPVGNLKHIDMQKVINHVTVIENLYLKNSEILKRAVHMNIHLALLSKYLSHEQVMMIQTALYNLFKINNNHSDVENTLTAIPDEVTERTICLINDENIKMYEYIPKSATTLFIVIRHENFIPKSLLKALLASSVGIIYIQYSEMVQESEARIAFNGKTVKTHRQNYFNILYDVLFYAKQYRLNTACIQLKNHEYKEQQISSMSQIDKRQININHNNLQFISKLIEENFEFTYQFQHQIEHKDVLDLITLEQFGLNVISPNVLEVDLINYPDNQHVYTYIIKLMHEALDENK